MACLQIREKGVLQRCICEEDLLTAPALDNSITVALLEVGFLATVTGCETHVDNFRDRACPDLMLGHGGIPVSQMSEKGNQLLAISDSMVRWKLQNACPTLANLGARDADFYFEKALPGTISGGTTIDRCG